MLSTYLDIQIFIASQQRISNSLFTISKECRERLKNEMKSHMSNFFFFLFFLLYKQVQCLSMQGEEERTE